MNFLQCLKKYCNRVYITLTMQRTKIGTMKKRYRSVYTLITYTLLILATITSVKQKENSKHPQIDWNMFLALAGKWINKLFNFVPICLMNFFNQGSLRKRKRKPLKIITIKMQTNLRIHQVTDEGYTGISPKVSKKHKLIQYFISHISGICWAYRDCPFKTIWMVDGNMTREERTASSIENEKTRICLNFLRAAKFTIKARDSENANA